MRSATGDRLAEEQWEAFAAALHERHRGFFGGGSAIATARAPGRMDVLGGVADYSGGTVLEATLAEAAFAAVQRRPDPVLRLRSVGAADDGLREDLVLSTASLLGAGALPSYAEAREACRPDDAGRWAGYVAGCLYVLVAEGHVARADVSGLNLLVDSAVPVGAGVSSSAALEVATMTALSALLGLALHGIEIARLCQIVENRVVGAPCGIMDQVTASLGRADHLLVLKCQPHDVLGHQPLPRGWRLVGVDSHVRHSVGGPNYTRARVAAFMGLKVLQTLSRDDWGGYLCNVPADVWAPWRERIPETLLGARFREEYGDLPDPVTRVDPDETYLVRACAEHPILENDRVREFLALMQMAGDEPDEQVLGEAGQLMLAAHESYNHRLRLGSPETDLLVTLAMERGPERGIFGAKITGGGSGGTVAILCSGPEAHAAIAEVRDAYRARTGITPGLMTGSTPGAGVFGARVLE